MDSLKERFTDYLTKSRDVISEMLDDPNLLQAFFQSVKLCTKAIGSQKKILIAGNGGSAADAQHFAAELVARYLQNRPSLPAIALTTDTSLLTAIANDFSYEEIFSRQIEGLASDGDIFIGISTSGRSKNILKALETARKKNLCTIGLTGAAAIEMKNLCDVLLAIPSLSTPLIQQGHLVLEHLLCEIIENQFCQGIK